MKLIEISHVYENPRVLPLIEKKAMPHNGNQSRTKTLASWKLTASRTYCTNTRKKAYVRHT